MLQVLAGVTFNTPRIPVYSNVTAALLTSAADIPAMLARQLVEPVQVTEHHADVDSCYLLFISATTATVLQMPERYIPWLLCITQHFLSVQNKLHLALSIRPHRHSGMQCHRKHHTVSCLQWEATLKALVAAGKTELYELGPGAQIKSMLKRIDNGVWKSTKTVAA